MKIDFYYWSCQCPLNHEMLGLLAEYRDRFEIFLHDITGNPELAGRMEMFYPTLTVVEEEYRFYSPLNRAFLDSLQNEVIPCESPYLPQFSAMEKVGEIVPITAENYPIAGACTGRGCPAGCERKIQFLRECGLPVYGFMNLRDGELLGGAEFLPSLLVPYDIPKDDKTAFLTCIYRSDPDYDYKSAPLRALEEFLTGEYERTVVISDEAGVFPNGNLAFFERNGYRDCGIVAHDHYCTLHLMEKPLSFARIGVENSEGGPLHEN